MEFLFASDLPNKEDLYMLYDSLDWNTFLDLSPDLLLKAMENSYYSIYVYDKDHLVATGRVVSDGIINAYICGLGVHPDYRHRGIGTAIMNMLVKHCRNKHLHLQFFCEDHLVPFYETKGFEIFAIGMKAKKLNYD